jgi:hypothetical protein
MHGLGGLPRPRLRDRAASSGIERDRIMTDRSNTASSVSLICPSSASPCEFLFPTSLDAARSRSMPLDAARCRSMPLDAARCRSIPLDAARCRSMPLDAARCRSMPLDAARSRSMPEARRKAFSTRRNLALKTLLHGLAIAFSMALDYAYALDAR